MTYAQTVQQGSSQSTVMSDHFNYPTNSGPQRDPDWPAGMLLAWFTV